jgi:hypothetical protein
MMQITLLIAAHSNRHSPDISAVVSGTGGDLSSILNRIVCEWAAAFPELTSDN